MTQRDRPHMKGLKAPLIMAEPMWSPKLDSSSRALRPLPDVEITLVSEDNLRARQLARDLRYNDPTLPAVLGCNTVTLGRFMRMQVEMGHTD